MFNFENLQVYQKSLKLSIELTKIASNFPLKYRRLQDQLIGAAISIALNIAEGSGRFNKREKIQFYRTAQSSAFELIPILDICCSIKLIDKNDYINTIEKICKMLSSLIRTLNSKN